MAMINVRVDDQVRDELKQMADAEGMSLSEFVRALLLEAVVPVFERDASHGEEPAPERMRLIDRQVLSLLHRMHARLVPEDGTDVDGDPAYQRMRAEILEEGFVGEYWYESTGFRKELSRRDCRRVVDVLELFRVITFSIEWLAKQGVSVDFKKAYALEFRGFDHHDPLEGHMAEYVEFLLRDRWSELKPQWERNDQGNSHFPTLSGYLRMLTVYRQIKDERDRGHDRFDYRLSLEELTRIADAS